MNKTLLFIIVALLFAWTQAQEVKAASNFNAVFRTLELDEEEVETLDVQRLPKMNSILVPTVSNLKLRTLPCGKTFTKLNKSSKLVFKNQRLRACNFFWLFVELNGKTGWVKSRFVKKLKMPKVPKPATKPTTKPTTKPATKSTKAGKPKAQAPKAKAPKAKATKPKVGKPKSKAQAPKPKAKAPKAKAQAPKPKGINGRPTRVKKPTPKKNASKVPKGGRNGKPAKVDPKKSKNASKVPKGGRNGKPAKVDPKKKSTKKGSKVPKGGRNGKPAKVDPKKSTKKAPKVPKGGRNGKPAKVDPKKKSTTPTKPTTPKKPTTPVKPAKPTTTPKKPTEAPKKPAQGTVKPQLILTDSKPKVVGKVPTEIKNVKSSCNSYLRYPDFKQFDNKWKDDKMGKKSKIEYNGSLLSSLSMVLNALGTQINSQTVTPKSLNAWFNTNSVYNAADKIKLNPLQKLGLKKLKLSKPINKNEVRKYVCSERSVILRVKDAYVLAVGIDSDEKTFIVNDPSSSARSKVDQNDVINAFVFSN